MNNALTIVFCIYCERVLFSIWSIKTVFEIKIKGCCGRANTVIIVSAIISRNNTIQTAIHHVVSIYYVLTPGKPSVIEIIPSFSLAYFLPKNYLTFQYLFICWSFFNFGSYQCCILVVSLYYLLSSVRYPYE